MNAWILKLISSVLSLNQYTLMSNELQVLESSFLGFLIQTMQRDTLLVIPVCQTMNHTPLSEQTQKWGIIQ